MAISVMAQTQSSPNTSADVTKWSGYDVEQSVELGYRFTDVNGSDPMYNTLVDFQQGPRLLEQTLAFRSPQHTGALFDNLLVSSFGWGGEPENVARLNISKARAYDFSFLFRRNHNYFDYDLFANPLNPPTATPYLPVSNSPHSYDLTRRMYDTTLTLLPVSVVTFRLGYSRIRSEGSSYSTFHEGTEVLLNQPWSVTQNLFRIGMDYKGLPHTTVSYNQFLIYNKNDTDYTLAPFATYTLPNGQPVELGLVWNPTGGSPCANPILPSGLANPACNGYFTYYRNQRVRTDNATEELRVSSDYFRRLHLFAGATYSSSDMNSPYYEFFNGLVTRTKERQFTFSGPANAKRINTSANFGMTWEITPSINLSDTFYFYNMRIPGQWLSTETATLAATTPATLLSPLGTTTSATDLIANFLQQKLYYNLVMLRFLPARKYGFNVGFKLRHRDMFKAEPEVLDPQTPFEAFEGDNIGINEYGPTGNLWILPLPNLRINLEAEALWADNYITRISPHTRRNYRARVNYKPRRWAVLSGTANIWNFSNDEPQAQSHYQAHYRNYGAVVTLTPRDRFALNLAYNYTDDKQNAYICYAGTYLAPGTVLNGCPTFAAGTNPNPNYVYSNYLDHTHYAMATVMVKPVNRLALNVGYGITDTGGNITILNPLQPTGAVDYTFQQPTAAINFLVAKGLSLNAYWNYDQYNEAGATGPTLPRYFHDNRTTLSARYAF